MSKYTNGDEFVLLNGNAYKGIYNIGPDNNYYTGEVYIFGISKILNEIENYNNDSNDKDTYYFNKWNKNVLNYNKLNEDFKENNIVGVKSFFPSPSKNDYKTGYIFRYFCRKSNDANSNIIEIDKNEFNKIAEINYWNKIKVKWFILGSNVEIYNKRTIKESELLFTGIEKYLSNLKQFSIVINSDII